MTEKLTKEFKKYFEANLLDGDDINDCGKAMVNAEECYEVVMEYLDRYQPEPKGKEVSAIGYVEDNIKINEILNKHFVSPFNVIDTAFFIYTKKHSGATKKVEIIVREVK